MNELVLSLFPGIGLLDVAFEEQGFCVVRGPDLLWGGDVKRFHPPAGRFDGVIGGPPCQQFSTWRHIGKLRGYKVAANLIPEYERCVAEARPAWFLMENVPDAPEPEIEGYAIQSTIVNNRWVGGVIGSEQNRTRRFSFGVAGTQAIDLRSFIEWSTFENPVFARAVMASGSPYDRTLPDGRIKTSNTGASRKTVTESLRLQDLPGDFFENAPFTIEGQQKMIGNGVPLPMGRAIATAVRRALAAAESERAA